MKPNDLMMRLRNTNILVSRDLFGTMRIIEMVHQIIV